MGEDLEAPKAGRGSGGLPCLYREKLRSLGVGVLGWLPCADGRWRWLAHRRRRRARESDRDSEDGSPFAGPDVFRRGDIRPPAASEEGARGQLLGCPRKRGP